MRMKRRAVALLMFATLLTGVGFAARRLAAQDNTNVVTLKIDNFCFTPMETTVAVGTTVTWINKDDVPHTVVSVDHKFKSQALDTDEPFSFTFKEPGTYEYFCSLHPKMVGKIVVK
jgi:plastocyanin